MQSVFEPNLSYIKALSKGDRKFERDLMRVVREELRVETALYEKHLQARQYIHAAEDVHKIKHKVSLLGMESAYEKVAQFEKDLRDGITTFQDEFMSILKIMANFLERNA